MLCHTRLGIRLPVASIGEMLRTSGHQFQAQGFHHGRHSQFRRPHKPVQRIRVLRAQAMEPPSATNELAPKPELKPPPPRPIPQPRTEGADNDVSNNQNRRGNSGARERNSSRPYQNGASRQSRLRVKKMHAGNKTVMPYYWFPL